MDIADSVILWFPVLAILGYLPPILIMDWRYRDIPHNTWIGLLPLFVTTGYLYVVGYYPIECMWLSFAAVGVWFVLLKLNMYGGADFILLSAISLFVVASPVSGRVLIPLVLAEFLLALIVCISVVIIMFRWLGIDTTFAEKFPFTFTIAAAFVLAVICG